MPIYQRKRFTPSLCCKRPLGSFPAYSIRITKRVFRSLLDLKVGRQLLTFPFSDASAQRDHISTLGGSGKLSVSVATAVARRSMVACHVCSSTDDSTYIEARGYRIARCTSCGLWFVNPQPTMEELRQFYAAYDDGEQWRNLEEHFNGGCRKRILLIKRSGGVLDVCCCSGYFFICMEWAGVVAFCYGLHAKW